MMWMHFNPEIIVASRGAVLTTKKALLAAANKFIGSEVLAEKIERAEAERTDLRVISILKRTVRLSEKIGSAPRLEDKHAIACAENTSASPNYADERLQSGKLPNLDAEENLLEICHMYMKLADHHAKRAGNKHGTSQNIELMLAEAYYSKFISVSRKLMAHYRKYLREACDELNFVETALKAKGFEYLSAHHEHHYAMRKLIFIYNRILGFGLEIHELGRALGKFKCSTELAHRKDEVQNEFMNGLRVEAYGIWKLPFVPPDSVRIYSNPEFKRHGK